MEVRVHRDKMEMARGSFGLTATTYGCTEVVFGIVHRWTDEFRERCVMPRVRLKQFTLVVQDSDQCPSLGYQHCEVLLMKGEGLASLVLESCGSLNEAFFAARPTIRSSWGVPKGYRHWFTDTSGRGKDPAAGPRNL